ncbi:unnamed protein product, partial [Discosporangium mesarthrocarpum]
FRDPLLGWLVGTLVLIRFSSAPFLPWVPGLPAPSKHGRRTTYPAGDPESSRGALLFNTRVCAPPGDGFSCRDAHVRRSCLHFPPQSCPVVGICHALLSGRSLLM